MKDSAVLKRSMFSEKLPKSVRNSGIMAGFEDDDMLEAPEKEDEMPVMARTPQNPEILMNNLRGDMRSVDARYQELAQMVGDEAAQETPPEVLAMLQMQFGQKQEGIGALPQGAGMMPPPMGGGAPMGAPGGAPAMPAPMPMGMPPQGAMPPGMEGAGPFPQGGAEQAPQQFNKGGVAKRRGDDAQLLEGGGGGGGFSAPTFSAPVRPPAFEVTPIGQAALAKPPSMSSMSLADLNKSLGSRFMSPQPTVSRLSGGDPAINLTRQGRESLIKDPATGVISPGTGTKFAPYTTMGPLTSPTFTQGFTQALNKAAADYPRVAALLPPSILAAVGIVGPTLTEEQKSTPLTAPEQAKYDETMALIDAVNRPTPPVQPTPQQIEGFVKAPPVEENVDQDPLGTFINQKLRAQEEREATTEDQTTEEFIKEASAKPKALTRIDRIRQARSEYEPLYRELLGDTKEDAKTNALLLLADAGFKLASTAKPTFAMALAESAKDLPRGFAAIVAQDKDRDIKVKTAALSQAISDVSEQDKYAQARQLKVLEGDYKLLQKQVEQGGIIIEDGGLGGRNSKSKNGSFLGFSIDPKDPAVTSAINSRYTLRQTDNPFVSNMGEAPTLIVEDKAGRLELGSTLAAHNNSLKSIENAKNSLSQLYSPGTFFVDKVNNLIVPVDFTGIIRPDLDQEAAKSTLMTLQNTLSKSIASANNSGRTAVQEQEWARQLTDAIANPTAFFKDRELAAKTLTSIETSIRNARQETLTQLGFEGNDYVMRTPNTGTKNDPFPISTDPAEQKIMYTFLGSTVGKLQDPKALVHLRMPNGQVQQFTPTQLRALNQ